MVSSATNPSVSTTTLNRQLPAREYVYSDQDRRVVDTLRVLAADAVEKVGSGHPGTAFSLSPVAWQLFQNIMHFDPSDAHWEGRDRFILSPGHTSLTLYLQLFAAGAGLEIEDLQALRTWGSKTPGHPEYGDTDHVEITTGPLGQGLASAVGFAYDQRRVRGLLDPEAAPGTSPFDHHIYVIASDGDLQEGVTAEASSLAGTQELGNLIVIWDDNKISIEDDTDISFTENVEQRYEAYGWHVQRIDWLQTGDYVEDTKALYEAIINAKKETDKPSLISLRTIIGWPSPKKQNTGGIHGAKLGAEELGGLKEVLSFSADEHFFIEDELLQHARTVCQRSAEYRKTWEAAYQSWRDNNPDAAKLYDRLVARELPQGFDEAFPTFDASEGSMATRAASGKVLSALADVMPELWGGSADLAGSNNTTMAGEPSFLPVDRQTTSWSGHPYGRTLHFGIREHASGAIVNGISLGGLTRGYAGTFLIFSDYMRPAVRLAALMGAPSIYVWTHDSIGLGEDGPTHQPVEHLAALRAIPNLDVVRPADANEVSIAWKTILSQRERPSGLILSRQGLPVFDRSQDAFRSAEGVARGAYIMVEASTDNQETTPEVVLIGTGSEVQLAVAARETLQAAGIATRVVSAPCLEWFDAQDEAYRNEVLPVDVLRVSIEAGVEQGWQKYTSGHGHSVSLEHFGASADYQTLFREFGITAEALVDKVNSLYNA
ncbi:transketolase [Enteractinococcus coprophilus]|uniref:Transketolase n=1 Tax=Enteractinococcus coprophilus TaxID=1027633 RepID=A0A543AJ78_9MICC|nr:transketolase [Enteractinococcus coprophilus]TQL72635.1 transketolase [Enteractinococcus coprophilus]